MQRNMDLCREILLVIERHPEPVAFFTSIAVDGHSQEEVWYHISLLGQAGLIGVNDVTTNTSQRWDAKDLTWAGHEFLDAYRDDTRWQKAKATAQSTFGALTMEGLKQLVPILIREGLKAAGM